MESFQKYFKDVSDEFKRGETTEHTFRSYLKEFIESITPKLRLSAEKTAIKKIGRPDYTCFRNNVKIGYIETKGIGINLEKELKGEQLKKYSEGAIPNIILTDYTRFILFKNQTPLLDVSLFDEDDLKKGKAVFKEEDIRKFKHLLESFLSYELPTIRTASELAIELSKRAKLLRDLAKEQLEDDLQKTDTQERSSVFDFYEAFKELIKDANVSDCVDAYSQTICYGLFLSKIGTEEKISRENASNFISPNIKIIKKIFIQIAGDELPKNLSWVVDEIVDILNSSSMDKILSEFIFEGKNYRDPFIHFYEDFLREYDKNTKIDRGVFYTPNPVVLFITRSVNKLLKSEFDMAKGFADNTVTVLDPATGTGTFLADSFILALKEIRNMGLSGIERDVIKNHLLKNFYGFEILVSPYIISHLKLSVILNGEGYRMEPDDRFQVYLTNSLDPKETIQDLKGFMKELTQETLIANTIKLKKPMLVILGNPPYYKKSSNNSKWIHDHLNVYKIGLNERRQGNLDDDYVKFFRFAQWKIEQTSTGIVSYITNNSYLDSPTFRKMRASIAGCFNKIYILNLHGDSNIGESTPGGGKDENVFNIQKGVAICILIKNSAEACKTIKYFDVWGTQKEKFDFLTNANLEKIEWIEMPIKGEFCFFKPLDYRYKNKYDTFISLKDIFLYSNTGLQTKNDEFLVNFSMKEAKDKIDTFINKSYSKSDIMRLTGVKDIVLNDVLGKKKYEFEIDKARSELDQKGVSKDLFVKYLYRPFDERYIYFDKQLISRSRMPLSLFMLKTNIALCVSRYTSMSGEYSSALITDSLIDIKYCEYSRGCFFFPLYYHNWNKKEIHQAKLNGEIMKVLNGKQPNFTENFLKLLKESYPNKSILPEDILNYIYAVLYSPAYRKKYNTFLKIDFPRIPFVKEYSLFKKLSELGGKLIDLHLMKINLTKNKVKFDIKGNNEVNFVKYKDCKAFINDKQCFDGIDEKFWQFDIGGYQVLDKWLKSRKGRKLAQEDIESFVKIVNTLSQTAEIVEKINDIKLD